MVTVSTGEIGSARTTPVEDWRRLVQKWQAKTIFFPDDCRDLRQMRDECHDLFMWRVLGYTGEQEFFEKALHLEYSMVEMACLALEVSAGNPVAMAEAVSKGESITLRRAETRELYADGWTQQAIADKLGVSQPTIAADLLSENTVQTPKPDKTRKVIQYTITQYTKPETAAVKIRAIFGDDFANQLKGVL